MQEHFTATDFTIVLQGLLFDQIKELKAFKKLEISAGEKEQVTFDIGFKDLGYYLPNGEFTLEKGEFDIYIGNNCKTGNKITIKVV